MRVQEIYLEREHDRFDPDQVAKIPREEVKLLYHLGYWDGPYSGVCSWNNKRYFFDCMKEETFTLDLEPGDEKYVDPEGPIPKDREWILKYHKTLADVEDLNESGHCFRYMALFELTEEEWEVEDKKHAAWRRYIGRHSDYDETGKRGIGEVGSEQGGPCDWDAWEEAKKGLPQMPKCAEERPIIGYFLLWDDAEVWELAQKYKSGKIG